MGMKLANLCTLGCKINDSWSQRSENDVISIQRLIQLEGKAIRYCIYGLYWNPEDNDYIWASRDLNYSEGFIIAIHLTNSTVLETAAFWKSEIDDKFPKKNILILLVGYKAELKSQRVITYEAAKKFSDESGIFYIEASIPEGKNVNKAFEVLLRYGLSILLKTKS